MYVFRVLAIGAGDLVACPAGGVFAACSTNVVDTTNKAKILMVWLVFVDRWK